MPSYFHKTFFIQVKKTADICLSSEMWKCLFGIQPHVKWLHELLSRTLLGAHDVHTVIFSDDAAVGAAQMGTAHFFFTDSRLWTIIAGFETDRKNSPTMLIDFIWLQDGWLLTLSPAVWDWRLKSSQTIWIFPTFLKEPCHIVCEQCYCTPCLAASLSEF